MATLSDVASNMDGVQSSTVPSSTALTVNDVAWISDAYGGGGGGGDELSTACVAGVGESVEVELLFAAAITPQMTSPTIAAHKSELAAPELSVDLPLDASAAPVCAGSRRWRRWRACPPSSAEYEMASWLGM